MPARPSRPPRSTSSSPSTTRRRPSSTRSGACTGSSPPSCPSPGGSSSPTTRASTTRRRSRAGWPRAARRQGPAPRGEGPRPRAARRLVREPAQVVCYMDVDLSTDLRGLLPLVAPLLSGHSDLAIGTRLAHGARVVRGPKRELISRGVQHHPPHGPARPLQRCAVRLQGGPHRRAARPHRRRARRRLVLRHRAARARPAARPAHPRGARRLGRRPRLARGHREDGVGRPARRRAARRRRRDRAVPARRRPVDDRLRAALPGAARPAGRRWREHRGARDHAVGEHRGQPPLHVRRPRARGPGRAHIRGAFVFVLTLGPDQGALAVLHGLDASPARWVELAVLIAASLAATVTRYVAFRTWVFASGAVACAARSSRQSLQRMTCPAGTRSRAPRAA